MFDRCDCWKYNRRKRGAATAVVIVPANIMIIVDTEIVRNIFFIVVSPRLNLLLTLS
jgi:hypothetical protein